MTTQLSLATAAFPYFEQPSLKLAGQFELLGRHFGPIELHLFGALVATAVIVGTAVIRKRAAREGIDAEIAARMTFSVLVFGFIGAHLVDRLIYFPHDTMQDPWSILKVWQGISSFGGIVGASVGAAWFMKKEKLGLSKWRYLDVIGWGFTVGWIFGRLGCFSAFDHPGTPTDFFLAEVDAKGIMRHNLGLYEALYFVPLSGLFWVLGQKRRAPGFYVALLCLLYPPVRFLFDFLRVVDVRYVGLTPAQWGSLGFMIFGFFLLRYTNRLAEAEALQEKASAAGVEPASAEAPAKRSGGGGQNQKKKRK
jgi:phosphatidylglycerol:prolipoprotein diacylglycerol transferase